MSKLKKILLVDDDDDLREALSEQLVMTEDFDVFEAANGVETMEKVKAGPYDLAILDVGLPDTDGRELCKRMRKAGVKYPVIMLTGHDTDSDTILGLDAGANDYITKPFSTRELISRIKAVLRRSSVGAADKAIEVDGLCLDPVSHRITANDEPVDMGPTEYRLLEFFMSHQERAYSRTQLLDQVWGANVYVEDRTIDVHIRRLRKALAPYDFDRFIQTVRGTGYRFSTKTARA